MGPWIKTALGVAVALFLGPSTAAVGEELSQISVAVEDTEHAVHLQVSEATSDNIRLYVLGEPNRVVIDITGTLKAPRKDLIPAQNPLVSAVRFGAHPGKTRIVADIKTRDVPTPSLIPTDTGTTIVLPVTPEVRAAFVATLSTATTPSEPQAVTGAVAAPESAPAPGQRLTELTFDRHPGDGSPIVRLGLTERPAFSFQKADAKTYRLTLPNCTVGGAELAFPQYPPDDFNGFTIVEIRQAGSSTEVLVGVEREFKITPSTTENAILIRSMPRG